MISRTYGLYRLEFCNKLPTSPQDLASKRASDPPIMAKIPQSWLNNHKNIIIRSKYPLLG
jgi:hypothetical protein